MDIVAKYGREDLAILYVAKKGERYLEFVESLQPPVPRKDKWVLILSTMYGCPVGCPMCDAGTYYQGKISSEVMFEQIDHLVLRRYPDKRVPAKKFKVQFARMGEPVLNPAVLEVLEHLPERFIAPGLMPCISTIAPRKGSEFLEKLLEIKERLYSNGHFQFQFSIHSTDPKVRDEVIPYSKWSLEEIASYGERFMRKNDRKVTLNFAAERGHPVDAEKIAEHFDPAKFIIKLTPLNPTESVKARNLQSLISPENEEHSKALIQSFEELGFEVILSIGELEENIIGSNCGQHALKFENGTFKIEEYMPFQEATASK